MLATRMASAATGTTTIESQTDAVSDESHSESTAKESEEGTHARVNYDVFFVLPSKPDAPSKCIAKCKLCLKPYKYTLSSKGNLLKRLQTSHPKKLHDHKLERSKPHHTLSRDGSLVRPKESSFKNQDKLVTCIVKHLCGQGRLPISVVEQELFRSFMKQVEPRFQPVSRVAVK